MCMPSHTSIYPKSWFQADICYMVSLLVMTSLKSWRGWFCFFMLTSSTLAHSTSALSDRKPSWGLLGTGCRLWAQKPAWFPPGLMISFISEEWLWDSGILINPIWKERQVDKGLRLLAGCVCRMWIGGSETNVSHPWLSHTLNALAQPPAEAEVLYVHSHHIPDGNAQSAQAPGPAACPSGMHTRYGCSATLGWEIFTLQCHCIVSPARRCLSFPSTMVTPKIHLTCTLEVVILL